MDCERWARKEAKRLGAASGAKLLEIRPKPGYRVIGGIRLPPNDQLFWPSTPWHYHFAVFAGGLARDEIYPLGLPLEQYKLKFEYHDVLDFKVRDP